MLVLSRAPFKKKKEHEKKSTNSNDGDVSPHTTGTHELLTASLIFKAFYSALFSCGRIHFLSEVLSKSALYYFQPSKNSETSYKTANKCG